ncbi:DUF2441 domain-containing protein [Acinetobacter dispersus]|uniref:DUF2441 domain-containing protein n=1 Tax=Acinetobacter dispersus TaxID=70348 RepID=UPI001F4AB330|nr:DUF2441 domain-containing protein [Acinetobacter dispersus]MCH7395220.1 DUF2441 domain-containing protein [Acinetobacter dispersus]
MHTFYHVTYHKNYNCFPDLEVGQQIIAGESYNPFHNYFYNTDENVSVDTPDGPQSVHYSSYLKYLANGKGFNEYPNPSILLPNLYGHFKNLSTLNRELILENIRLAHYPQLPSRFKCLWVTPSYEESAAWIFEFLPGQDKKIVTLTSNSPIIRVDSNFLPLATDSLGEKERKAHAYWSGEESDNPKIEYLFAGTAEIIAVNSIHLDSKVSALLGIRE